MRQAGGVPRLGFFTTGNVYRMLTNKAYIGTRVFKVGEESYQSKAVWPALIDEFLFNRVNRALEETSPHRRWKYKMQRYPYLLSGLVWCGKCGDRLCGKSAHGKTKKIPYYEHSWALRKESCLTKKFFDCKPTRVSAQKLEKEIWEKLEGLILNEKLASDMIGEAGTLHQAKGHVKEADELRKKSRGIGEQIVALTDHLAKIPKDLSPMPIYAKMQELQELKTKAENQLSEIMRSGAQMDVPVAFSDYSVLISKVREILHGKEGDDELRHRIVQKLVHKVEVLPEGYRVHYFVGRNYVVPTALEIGASPQSLENRASSRSVGSSKMLLTGAGHRVRTPGQKAGSNGWAAS